MNVFARFLLVQLWILAAIVTFFFKKKNGGVIFDFVGITILVILGLILLKGGWSI